MAGEVSISGAWRDVADEEPDGHQLAYVTERLLVTGLPGSAGIGMGDFEMVAQTDIGFAVLVAKGDPEVETLQWEDFEDFGDFVAAAKKNPEFVEVADPGPNTAYRAGTLALEEIGIDLSPKSPANKTPTEAIYDADVEAALVPLNVVVLSDVLVGELEALAVLADERCPDLPGVPTAKELGYDVTVPVFGGIAAPDGTPRRVVGELGRVFVASSSSRTFERALLGSARKPMARGRGISPAMSRGKRECYTGPATLDGARILRMRGGQVYDRSSVLEVGERPAGRDAEAFKGHH